MLYWVLVWELNISYPNRNLYQATWSSLWQGSVSSSKSGQRRRIEACFPTFENRFKGQGYTRRHEKKSHAVIYGYLRSHPLPVLPIIVPFFAKQLFLLAPNFPTTGAAKIPEFGRTWFLFEPARTWEPK